MLTMASSAASPSPQVAANLDKKGDDMPPLWSFLGLPVRPRAWVGCTFWDLIQPSFMFMVGVAMPYSYRQPRRQGASRTAGCSSTPSGARCLLILLAVFLSSPHDG